MDLKFLSRSSNESFARAAVAAFVAQIDPTIDELADIKTAVSEAVTNCIVHAYREDLGMIYINVKLFENGTIAIRVRDKGCGIPDVEKAITLAPEEETSYLLRGRIHEAMGNIDAAAADYQNVLELNPFNDEATLLVGQLLITQERLDEAITFFNEAIDLKPDFGKAYAERGRAKNLKGDKDGAFEDLKKSIELNPEGDEARKLEGQHTNFNDMYKGGIF